MHILAVRMVMIHQHKFCVYKGKRKLTLPITFANFVLFALYPFLFCFVNIFLENVEKSLRSRGVGVRRGCLERVGLVTLITALFSPKHDKIKNRTLSLCFNIPMGCTVFNVRLRMWSA